MYSRVLILVVCLAAAVLGGLAYRWTSSRQPIDARLAEVSFNDLDGTPQRMDQWAGQILVVNFWATWCPPCKEEMPEFSRAQEEWGPRGVQFVGIAVDDPSEVRAYLATNPVSYPILMGERDGAEWATRLGDVFQVLPFTAVIDRSGQVVRSRSGAYSRDELRDLLSSVVGEAAG